ncbi:MAG TPA: cyclase family protein [Longimicrobium sp.]|nr:cyclase family protein [Longimicrobium sp.]
MPESRRIIHDATRPVFTGMPVWPGDTPCDVRRTARLADGDQVNGTAISCSVHTGTHADGPYHVLEDGIRIGDAPLEAFLGPAHLVDAGGLESIEAGWLAAHLPPGAERVLFRTGCWRDRSILPTRFPAPTPDAARLLVERGIRLIGTDAPSVDPFDSPDLPAHHIVLRAGMGILENLLLDGIAPGAYELIALPLRLADADSSPVRAILLETP